MGIKLYTGSERISSEGGRGRRAEHARGTLEEHERAHRRRHQPRRLIMEEEFINQNHARSRCITIRSRRGSSHTCSYYFESRMGRACTTRM